MGKRIGYIRTDGCPDISVAIEELVKAGCDQQNILIDETPLDGSSPPPQVINILLDGDTLVVCRLDEMGYSMNQIINWIYELRLKGIHFKSILESIVDTTATSGANISDILCSLAQIDKDLRE